MVKPQISSYMYLVFENITMFLWFELLNHCIPNLHWLLPAAYTIQKEICDFENAPCECSSLRLIYIACGPFYRYNKK